MYDGIEVGESYNGSRNGWHNGQQGDNKEKRRLERETDAVEGQATAERGGTDGEETRGGTRGPKRVGTWGPPRSRVRRQKQL